MGLPIGSDGYETTERGDSEGGEMVNAHETGSPPPPSDNQASNGEIVPDDDASAESLRHSADLHPASDHEPPVDAVEEGESQSERHHGSDA